METYTGLANLIRFFGDNDEIYDQLQRVFPEALDYEPDMNYNEVLIYGGPVHNDDGTTFAYRTVVFLEAGEVLATGVVTTEIQ